MKFTSMYPPSCPDCQCWLVMVRTESGLRFWQHGNSTCENSLKTFKMAEIELEEIEVKADA